MLFLYDRTVPALAKGFPGVPRWKAFAMSWLVTDGLVRVEKDYLVPTPMMLRKPCPNIPEN